MEESQGDQKERCGARTSESTPVTKGTIDGVVGRCHDHLMAKEKKETGGGKRRKKKN